VNPLLLGFLALLALLVIGSFFRERSLRHLDVTQAGTLVLVVRPYRVRLSLVIVGSVLLWFLLVITLPGRKTALMFVFLASIVIAMGIAQVIAWRALRKHSFPPEFWRNYGAAAVLNFLGYVMLLGGVAATSFLHRQG
jgi:hypothetical protein